MVWGVCRQMLGESYRNSRLDLDPRICPGSQRRKEAATILRAAKSVAMPKCDCPMNPPRNPSTPYDSGSSRVATGGISSGRTVRGSAAYAKVTLGRDEDLSFWNDTEVTDRLYFVGLDMFPWPEGEMVHWQKGESSGRFSRAWMDLSPSLRLVRRRAHPKRKRSG